MRTKEIDRLLYILLVELKSLPALEEWTRKRVSR